MERKTAAMICLLTLLAIVHTAESKPASRAAAVPEAAAAVASAPLENNMEQARQLWNRAKRAYNNIKRIQRSREQQRVQEHAEAPVRARRDVNETDGLDGVTGSKYIIQLYKRMTSNSSLPRESAQANTIRSLPFYTQLNSECNEYNFNLTAMNSSEVVMKSELHLYQEIIPRIDPPSYVVVIEVQMPNGEQRTTRVMKEVTDLNEGYVVFDVAQLTRTLLDAGEQTALFTVNTFKTAADAHTNNHPPMLCQEVNFVHDGTTEDNTPLLVVYTYNPAIEKINYNALKSRTATTQQQATSERKRRNSDITLAPACGKLDLTVKREEIGPALTEDLPLSKVVEPAQFNAGICGGQCSSTPPDLTFSNHAPVIHLLIPQEDFRGRHAYSYVQCCAPIRYRALEIMVQQKGSLAIVTLDDLIIDDCSCLDIVDFS